MFALVWWENTKCCAPNPTRDRCSSMLIFSPFSGRRGGWQLSRWLILHFFFFQGWLEPEPRTRERTTSRKSSGAPAVRLVGSLGTERSERLPSACRIRYPCGERHYLNYLNPVPRRKEMQALLYTRMHGIFWTQHLVDPDEAFWKLSLLWGPKVHPHSALSVPLQRISPPLTCGSPLSSAHPAHAPAL